MEYSDILEIVKKIISGLENIVGGIEKVEYEGVNFRVKVYKVKDTVRIDIKELNKDEE